VHSDPSYIASELLHAGARTLLATIHVRTVSVVYCTALYTVTYAGAHEALTYILAFIRVQSLVYYLLVYSTTLHINPSCAFLAFHSFTVTDILLVYSISVHLTNFVEILKCKKCTKFCSKSYE